MLHLEFPYIFSRALLEHASEALFGASSFGAAVREGGGAMDGQKKRRKLQPGICRDGPYEEQTRRTAGYELFRVMLALFAEQKLTAQDFCVLCHWANEAGTAGADYALYSSPPGKQTGSYQDLCFSDSSLCEHLLPLYASSQRAWCHH